jgi:hypothetical protein
VGAALADPAANLDRQLARQLFPGAIDEQQPALAIEQKQRLLNTLEKCLPANVTRFELGWFKLGLRLG